MADTKFLLKSIIEKVNEKANASSLEGLASESYVNTKIAEMVDSAPETLDTLNELAAALGDDPNFATTIANQISTKVDKIEGKGLSTNDYTSSEKTKLAGIATGATANIGTITGVTASTGLSGGGTSGAVSLSLATSGVTAGSYGPTGNVSGSNGATISVPQITVDNYGRVTSIINRTYTSVDTNTHAVSSVNNKTGAVSLTYSDVGAAASSHGTHLTLGTTSSTAYRGDYGNTAYTHSQSTHAPTNAQKNSDITKAEIEAKLTGAITSHTHAYAASSHNHGAGEITSGTLAVARGGTGLTASPSMLVNLGSTSAANVLQASPRPGITGTLGVANGGTGATSKSGARTNLGITSGTELPSSGTNGDIFVKYDADFVNSTDEVLTGATWIDGKPIYRFILKTTISGTGSKNLGKLPSVPETIINLTGTMKNIGQSNSWRPLTFIYYGNLAWGCSVYIDNSQNIYAQLGSSISGTSDIYFIAEYTKA